MVKESAFLGLKQLFFVIVVATSVVFGISYVSEISGATTHSVSCNTTWWPGNGQKMIISGVQYQCSADVPYCKADTQQCCKWDASEGYGDCKRMPASDVQCVFEWPQRISVDGTEYSCGTNEVGHRYWCNNEKASQGIAECCAAHSPYTNCVLVEPTSEETRSEASTQEQESEPLDVQEQEDLDADSVTYSDYEEQESEPLDIQEPECSQHSYFECYQGDIYWRNSCGELEELKKDCGGQGCKDDACVTCTDTDQGVDLSRPGKVIDTVTSWVGSAWTDVCENGKLVEFYCEDDNIHLKKINCPLLQACEEVIYGDVMGAACTPIWS